MKKNNTFYIFYFLTIGFAIMLFSSCTKTDDLADTLNSTSVTDIDGNKYKIITIGTQVWMAENLRVTKYNNSDPINLISDATIWSKLSTGAYCNYDNDLSASNTYGKLYNWYAVKTGILAPKGWHIPTDAEWTTLKNYLIANKYNYDVSIADNKIAKSLSSINSWNNSTSVGAIGNDISKNNSSGFSALPGGNRTVSGSFDGLYQHGYWWSSIDQNDVDNFAGGMDLYFDDIKMGTRGAPKNQGCSIRCIKD